MRAKRGLPIFQKNFIFSPFCSVDDVLGQSLDEVIRQGLLDPLVPYLTSTASAATSSGGGNSGGSGIHNGENLVKKSGSNFHKSSLKAENLVKSMRYYM